MTPYDAPRSLFFLLSTLSKNVVLISIISTSLSAFPMIEESSEEPTKNMEAQRRSSASESMQVERGVLSQHQGPKESVGSFQGTAITVPGHGNLTLPAVPTGIDEAHLQRERDLHALAAEDASFIYNQPAERYEKRPAISSEKAPPLTDHDIAFLESASPHSSIARPAAEDVSSSAPKTAQHGRIDYSKLYSPYLLQNQINAAAANAATTYPEIPEIQRSYVLSEANDEGIADQAPSAPPAPHEMLNQALPILGNHRIDAPSAPPAPSHLMLQVLADEEACTMNHAAAIQEAQVATAYRANANRIAAALDIPGFNASMIEAWLLYSHTPKLRPDGMLNEILSHIKQEADILKTGNIGVKLTALLNELNTMELNPALQIPTTVIEKGTDLKECILGATINEMKNEDHRVLKYLNSVDLYSRYKSEKPYESCDTIYNYHYYDTSLVPEKLIHLLPFIHYELRERIIFLLYEKTTRDKETMTMEKAQYLNTKSDPLFQLIKETLDVFNMCYHVRPKDKASVSVSLFQSAYNKAFSNYIRYSDPLPPNDIPSAYGGYHGGYRGPFCGVPGNAGRRMREDKKAEQQEAEQQACTIQ